MRYFVFSQCLKITEKSLIKHYFCKPEAYGHTVLSDILIGEKVVGNAKTQMRYFCDFQTLCSTDKKELSSSHRMERKYCVQYALKTRFSNLD